MNIAIGADNWGFTLKEAIKADLIAQGHNLQDLGVPTDDGDTPYYQTAAAVARLVSTQQVDRGILCCGTGMGMAIIANKFSGVYAAVCETTHAAEQARAINNSNVLTLGEMFTTPTLAKTIVATWLQTAVSEDWDPAIQTWLDSAIA